MILFKKSKITAKNRIAVLAEFEKLQSMATSRIVKAGLNWMKLLYIKSINTKRSSTNTPEQKAKYAQESYQRTMHGNKRNSRWNDRDELIVMNAEIPDEEIALLLGRTTKAIRRKRDKLLSNNILL